MSIDNRIVQMTFDNKQFESGIKESLQSLLNLKKGLDLEGAAKGLSELEKIGKGFSLSSLGENIDYIADRFSVLGIMGITALQNITNAAISTGTQMVKSLTLDPIMSGFQKYEQKTEAVQTIMNATGMAMDDVTESMQKLQWFTDETSYSFTDMVTQIGKFTSQGIELDTSIDAMQGIATWSALSGTNIETASRAMYHLSKSIGIGSVRLMEWQTIENANMATVEFKESVIETAKAMGTLTEAGATAKGEIVDIGNFAQTLNEGWFDRDVLLTVLEDYGGFASELYAITEETGMTAYQAMEQAGMATEELGYRAFKAAQEAKTFTDAIEAVKEAVSSGWMQSFEIIFGNYEESVELWSAVTDALYDIFAEPSWLRNEMLQGWKDLGGRDKLIEAVANAFEALGKAVTPVAEAFREFFPAITSEGLYQFSEGLADLTEKFKIGDETADKIFRSFSGLFAILDIGRQGFVALADGLGQMIGYILPVGDGFLSATASIGDFFVALNEAVSSSDFFNRALETLGNFMAPIADGVATSVSAIFTAFSDLGGADLSGLDTFSEKVKERFQPLTELGGVVAGVFNKIIDVIAWAAPVFFTLADIIGDALGQLRDKIVGAFEHADFQGIHDLINSTLFSGVLVLIMRFITALTDVAYGDVGFLGIFEQLRASLEAFQWSLKADVLKKLAVAIAILAGALVVLSMVDSENLTKAIGAMSVMFTQLLISMAILQKISLSKGVLAMERLGLAMITMSTAVLILSAAMTIIARLDWEAVTQGLIAVGTLSAILVTSAHALSSSSGKMIRGAGSFILLAAAITILTIAVERLGELDTDVVMQGLMGVGVLAAQLAIFMKVSDFSGMGVSTGLGLIGLAAALVVLSEAVRRFGELDREVITQGLIGVGVILAQVGIFTKVTAGSKGIFVTAVALTILAASMLIFGAAIEKMGSLHPDVIGNGLLAMAGALTAIVVAMSFMPPNMIASSLAMIAIATALVILSHALANMGSMTWEEIGAGLVVLGGALTIIATAMSFMTTALPGAAALLIIAAALAILSPVLRDLGGMSVGEIARSLIVLAGAFAVIGLAAVVLGPLVPVILSLAGALALLGIASMAVGGGIMLLSAGLAALAISGAAGAAALVLVISSIIGLIPHTVKVLAEALISFAKVIGEGAPIIGEALVKVLVVLIDAIITIIPKVVEALGVLIITLLDFLIEVIPKLTEAGMLIILGFLKGISDNIKEVVETAVDVVVNFIEGVSSKIGDVIQAGFELMVAFIDGLAEAIKENTLPMLEAIRSLMIAIGETALEVLLSFVLGFDEAGVELVLSLIKGIHGMFTDVRDEFNGLALSGIEALKENIEAFHGVGASVITGFISGMQSRISDVTTAARGVASRALESAMDRLGMRSPSREFAKIGMYADEGFAAGLTKYASRVADASKEVGEEALDALSSTIASIGDILNSDVDMEPTIRPVIDLTDVEKGLDSTFGRSQNLKMAMTADKLEVTARNMQAGRGGGDISQNTTNTTESKVTMNNYFTVRDDHDIETIARKLYQLEKRHSRGGVSANAV